MTTFGTLVKEVASEDFRDFVTYWFNPGQLICLVGIPASGQGKRLHTYVTYEDVLSDFDDQLLFDMCHYEGGMNMYFTVNPVLEDLGLHRRGGVKNIAACRGLYADIDVNKEGKKGVFSSEEEIMDFLNEIDLFPSSIVQSGSGGLHCYWRINNGITNEVGSDLQTMWWSYLNEKAGDREIDRLIDISRILRIPGSLRFPKEEESSSELGEVRVLHFEEGTYQPNQIRELSKSMYTKYVDDKREKRKKLTNQVLRIDENMSSWSDMIGLAEFQDRFNEEVTWDEILVPHGWTFIREDYQGRREWARPGSESKSAVTDWGESPHVMSLMSTSPDTQLDDLKDADVALTKFRVALRLHYNDNDSEFFKDWKRIITD